MSAILLSLATFFSTLIGGLFGLRYRDHLNLIMGFTAGVLVGLVSFDLLPEIFRLVYTLHLDSTGPMLALMGGFLLPFSYSNVCKAHLSGQLFPLLRGLPAHGNLWISPPVSVSHPLHRHFTSGRSHYPGRPALRYVRWRSRSLANHARFKAALRSRSIESSQTRH